MSKSDASPSLKDVAAALTGAGAAPAADAAPAEYPEKGYVKVKAPTSELHHVLTGAVFSEDPKKVEIDAFVKAQIEAGKLQIVEP